MVGFLQNLEEIRHFLFFSFLNQGHFDTAFLMEGAAQCDLAYQINLHFVAIVILQCEFYYNL